MTMTMAGPTEPMRSHQIRQQANVTERQLNWWVIRGYVSPSVHKARGSGDQHLWNDADLRTVQLLARISSLLSDRMFPVVASVVATLPRGTAGGYLVIARDGTVLVVESVDLVRTVDRLGAATVVPI